MDFLDISSLGFAYQYAIKIDHKFRHQNKWEFGYVNLQQPKHGKDGPNQQPPDNQYKTQKNKGKGKTKNGTGKSLVVEVKDKDSNPDSEFDPKNIENR